MKLGWVASAEVRRILPSRLEVLVSEREPFARWADAENIVQVIDREGRILDPRKSGSKLCSFSPAKALRRKPLKLPMPFPVMRPSCGALTS